MKTYSLLPHDDGFYFGDGNKHAVREIFRSKQQGVDILMDMFFRRRISSINALELMKKVIALPNLPIVERAKGNIDWLNRDFEELTKMKAMEHLLLRAERPGKYKEPTVVLCANCKEHANIFCLNFYYVSEPFYSKEDGRAIIEIMRDDEFINLAEQLKLEKELAEINLPEKTPKTRNPLKEN